MRRRIKQVLWETSPSLFKFMTKPHDGQHFSIGIYRGSTPIKLRPPIGIKNPVLTRDDVTDVPAAFVADPFMVRSGDTWHLFFEVMNKATSIGQIGLATSSDGHEWQYASIVLSEPFHMAYPYVLRHGAEFFMVPDTPDEGIRLYRAAPFPNHWEYVATLLEGGRFSDSSLFEHYGRWWMLTAWSPEPSQLKSLRLFGADSPLGPWHEHPASPVMPAGANRTRPAGRVVIDNGKPIRFAQDSFPEYGSRVRGFEIVRLDQHHYEERQLKHGRAVLHGCGGTGWNADGMHHVDAHLLADGSWIACVDGWYA